MTDRRALLAQRQRAKLQAPDIVFPFRQARQPRQCPAITVGWCQAPWTCAQPCTGRGGDSHARKAPQ